MSIGRKVRWRLLKRVSFRWFDGFVGKRTDDKSIAAAVLTHDSSLARFFGNDLTKRSVRMFLPVSRRTMVQVRFQFVSALLVWYRSLVSKRLIRHMAVRAIS